MALLSAYRWHGWNLREPQMVPPYPLQQAMLGEIEALLRKGGLRPVTVECLSWARPPHIEPTPGNAALGMILITGAPGLLPQSLRTWFVWQHPRWRWAEEPLPELPELEHA